MTASGSELRNPPATPRGKTREALLDEIRDRQYEVFDRSVDVHISALRKKLGDDPKTPRFIRTVRSAGYLCHPKLDWGSKSAMRQCAAGV